MNQIICPQQAEDVFKICKYQYEKNQRYIQAFIYIRNDLINLTGQLLQDFQTLNSVFQEKITKYSKKVNSEYIGQQNLNLLKGILNKCQISDLSSLNQMENLQDEFIKTIKDIQKKILLSKEQVQVFEFHSYIPITESQNFKEFQEQNYVESEILINNQYEVNAAEISPDETLLVTISRNYIFLWDYMHIILRQRYSVDSQITTFTFANPSNRIIFGDSKGRIHQIFVSDSATALTNSFQVHSDDIYDIIIPQKNQILTCSKDNKIKLINTLQSKILLTINYLCPCQSNFIYNQKQKVIIAPNWKNICIYNSKNGKQLQKTYYGEEKLILQILSSNNCTELYIHLHYKRLINIYKLDSQIRKIVLSKIIKLQGFCYNISLCFDKVLILLFDVGFEFISVEDDNLILIKEIQAVGTERYKILTIQTLLQQVASKVKQVSEPERFLYNHQQKVILRYLEKEL